MVGVEAVEGEGLRVMVGQDGRGRLIAVVDVIVVRVEVVVVGMEAKAGAAVAGALCEVEEGGGVALGDGEVAVAAGEECGGEAAGSDTAQLLLMLLLLLMELLMLVVAPDLCQALLLHQACDVAAVSLEAHLQVSLGLRWGAGEADSI